MAIIYDYSEGYMSSLEELSNPSNKDLRIKRLEEENSKLIEIIGEQLKIIKNWQEKFSGAGIILPKI